MLVNKPPMGWNTWNTFGEKVSDELLRGAADAFVAKGLKDAGYEYIVLDDCWSQYNRDPKTHQLLAEPSKFPHGMKAVGDYIHQQGLKFGMYSCAGQRTCADYPGSFDHEFLDAQTFADWGVDYLKYDFCYKPDFVEGKMLYRRMGMALRATGRDIVYSACNWGVDDVWSWIRQTGAHLYRTTGDIVDTPESYRKIIKSQLDKLSASGPQCFNDTDMLTVGMYGQGFVGATGCTDADYRSQFALWCMISAPLMLGCDVRTMSDEAVKLVTNKQLIRINQDSECRPPMVLKQNWQTENIALFKHLDDGSYAVGFFNMDEEDKELYLTFSDVGLPASAGYDLEMEGVLEAEGKQVYREYMRVNVPAHDCKIFIARPVKQ